MSYTQRETPILAELTTLLVESTYGELAARVFSVLARHGRQTLAAIVRASYLNGRQIKYGIAILLQQNVIFHSANDASVAYYEIDWQNAYALVRLSKVVSCVEDRLGKKAGNVVSNLLALGHSRISDLTDAYFPPESNSDDESDNGIPNGAGAGSKRKRANGTEANGTATKSNGVVNGGQALDDAKPTMNGANGTTAHHEGTEEGHDEIASADELINIIQKLMERGWIMTMTEAQYLSPGDIHDMLQKEAIDDYHAGSAPTGIKGKKELHAQILAKKRDMRDGWLQIPKFFRNRPTDNHLNGSSKRVKLNAPNGSAAAANAHSPVDDLVIRVNPEKINVAMRTDQLVQLAEQRIGSTTASVYKLMLRIIENATARCYEEWPEPPPVNGDPPPELPIDPRLLVTARDVAKSLPRDFDICDGLDPHAIIAVTRKGHVRSANILSQPVDPADLRLDQLTELVDQHIQLLAMDPFRFATWNSRAGFSQWQIEFDNLAQKMIQDQIEKTVSSRKGRVGVKLVRSLRKKGKLDERATCNVMMMSAVAVRGIINDLTVQGILCTQEIPKVERREAKHSLHFVWYDRQRAREKLLHDCYKGAVRILQRISFEREKIQPLISKAERSDVVGNESKYLSPSELDALKKWQEVQQKLLLQLAREDDLIATLRDFNGPLTSV